MPDRRLVVAALFVAPFAAVAAAAPPADTPEAFLAAIYARITAGDGRKGGSEFIDPAVAHRWFTAPVLKQWAAADAKAEKDGDIGPVDFDLLTASQDPLVRRVAIESGGATADAATVRVALFAEKKAKPGEKPYSTLKFTLVRQTGGWRIDDVEEVSGDHTWKLRELIAPR